MDAMDAISAMDAMDAMDYGWRFRDQTRRPDPAIASRWTGLMSRQAQQLEMGAWSVDRGNHEAPSAASRLEIAQLLRAGPAWRLVGW